MFKICIRFLFHAEGWKEELDASPQLPICSRFNAFSYNDWDLNKSGPAETFSNHIQENDLAFDAEAVPSQMDESFGEFLHPFPQLLQDVLHPVVFNVRIASIITVNMLRDNATYNKNIQFWLLQNFYMMKIIFTNNYHTNCINSCPPEKDLFSGKINLKWQSMCIANVKFSLKQHVLEIMQPMCIN